MHGFYWKVSRHCTFLLSLRVSMKMKNEYGALGEWYFHGKNQILGKKNQFTVSLFTTYSAWTGSRLELGLRLWEFSDWPRQKGAFCNRCTKISVCTSQCVLSLHRKDKNILIECRGNHSCKPYETHVQTVQSAMFFNIMWSRTYCGVVHSGKISFCLCFKGLESVKQFLLAVTGLGLVMSTVQRFRSEGDVLVVIGKTKVKLPLCRPGQTLEV